MNRRSFSTALLVIVIMASHGCYAVEPKPTSLQENNYANQVDLTPRAGVFVVKKGTYFYRDPSADQSTHLLQPGEMLRVVSVKGPKVQVRKGDNVGWVERTAVDSIAGAWFAFTTNIRKEPNDPVWLLGRGSVLASLDHHVAAEKDLRRALSLGHKTAFAHACLGDLLSQCEKYDEAIHQYSEAASLEPNSGEHVSSRGVARMAMGNVNGALDDHRRAVELSDDRVQSLIQKAAFHLQQKAHREAVADCTLALRSRPDFGAAYLIRAEAHLGNGNIRDALADLESGAKLGPQRAMSLAVRFLPISTKELEDNPTDSASLVAQSFGLDKSGDMNEARQTLVKLLRDHDGSAPGWFLKGLIHHRLGEHAEALQAFDHAADLGVYWGFMNHCRGQSHRELGQFSDAARRLEHAIQLDPTRVDSWNELILTYEQAGKIEQALAAAELAVLVGGGSEPAFRTRGRLRLNRGLAEEAFADAEAALSFWAFSGQSQQLRTEAYAIKHKTPLSVPPPETSDNRKRNLATKIDQIISHAANSVKYQEISANRFDALAKVAEEMRQFAPPPRANLTYVRSDDLRNWYARVAKLKNTRDEIDFAYAVFGLENWQKLELAYENLIQARVMAVLSSSEIEQAKVEHSLQERLRFPIQYIITFHNAEHLQSARKVLAQLIAARPNDPAVKVFQGDLHRALLEHDLALEAYNQALKLQPKSAAAVIGRGHVFFRKGELEKALADFELYLKLDGPTIRKEEICFDQRGRLTKVEGIAKAATRGVQRADQELIFAGFDEPPPIVLYVNPDGNRISINSINKYHDFVAANQRAVIKGISGKLMADDLLREGGTAIEQFVPFEVGTVVELIALRQFARE